MNQDYKFMKRMVLKLPPLQRESQNIRPCIQSGFLFIAFLLLMSIPVRAQIYPVSAYTFAQSSGTYTPITGTEATSAPTAWDEGNATLPIGFNFVMNGTGYTNVNLSYNGYVTFGVVLPAENTYSPLSNGGSYDSAISAFGTNLKGSEGITYSTTGNAPNRTFIVQWNNAKRSSSLGADVLNFQIQLHETTNVIDIVYGTCTATLSSATVQAGIRGATSSDFNSRTSSASWATTTASTFSGASISTSPIIMPANGLKFSYTPPPACVAPAAPVAVANGVTPTAATIVITPSATPVTGYVVIRSSSPTITIPPANGTIYYSGTSLGGNTVLSAGTQTSINDNGLMPNTSYYYFLYAFSSTTCGGGPLYSPAATIIATTCVPATVAAATSNITNTSATINWSKIMGTTPTYDLEVYTNAAFTNLFGTVHNGLTATSFNLTGLSEGTTYYYRVKGQTGASCTDSSFSTGSFTARSGLTPLSITPADFNADVIANGPGFASASTNQPVDDAEYSYVAQDYRNNINVLGNSYGLPLNRTLTGMDGTPFLLADYSGNNALRLGSGTTTGTLHLATPVKLSSINIAATSGAGSSSVNIKILFSDNTSQDMNGIPINDWFDNGYYIVTGIGRVNRTDDYQDANPGDAKIFQIPVNIDISNQGKTITGVEFTKVSGQIPNIFALTGRILTNCPAINWVSHTITSASSATLNWGLATAGEGATSVTYSIGVYTDEAFTTPVPGFPVQNIQGASYSITGLAMDRPYYVRLQANNGTCTSAYATDVINISYCTPSVFSLPNMGITNVILGAINHTAPESEAYDKYNNYSNLSATSWPGGNVNFSISANPGDPGYQTKIWVDFNNDTDFDDDGELVSVIDNNTEYPFTATNMFTVPLDAPIGNHRLRIGMAQNRFNETGPEPCFGRTGDYQDYTLKIVAANCAVITVTPSIVSSSSIKLDWILNNPGTGTTPTYVAEVYNDAAFTLPVTGSPFNVTAQTLTITGLASGTYYYKVRANNGVCTSEDVTGSIVLMPCIPSNSATDSLANSTSSITNVTTTNGFVNITNTTGQTSGYTDYSYMAVKQAPGGSFNYSVTVNGFTAVTIWVDWNNDLVFNSTNEQIANFASPAGTLTGTITIPAGTALGNYRMRIRSRNGSNMSPCDLITWSEAEDYTITVANAPNCFVPQNLTATAIGTSATISWTAPATGIAPVGYEYAASTSVTPPTGSGIATTATSVPVTLVPNTTNYIYVRSSCGESNYSDWAVVVFYAGYCAPNGSDASNFINDFATSGAITNISNAATGYSESGYGDFTNKTVSQTNLGRVNFTSLFGNGVATYGFAVWVDWNDDYDFNDAGEQVYRSTTYATGASGFFTIPTTAALGNHRMRILADYDDAAPNNPCAFRNTRGEAEDYTLIVTPAVVCPTIDAVAAVPSTDGATVSWTLTPPTDTNPVSYTIEVYSDATYTTQISGSPFTTTNMSYTVNGLAAQTTYYYQVMATKTGCTSAFVRGSFTTRCATPTAEPSGNDEQTFDTNDTVATLEIVTIEGAVVQWYIRNENGIYTAIPVTTILEDGKTYYVSQTVNGCESNYLAITANRTAGTGNYTFKNLSVYPNPATSSITLTNSNVISGIQIINILGQTIIAKQSDSSNVKVNVEQLPAATYIIQIYSEGNTASLKFVKQ